MPYQDFREFLESLRSARELIEVDRAVAPELEVAKAMRKSASVSGPALIFNNTGAGFPLVGGACHTRAKASIALLRGTSTRIPSIVVADAPVHENVVAGKAVDISKILLPQVVDIAGFASWLRLPPVVMVGGGLPSTDFASIGTVSRGCRPAPTMTLRRIRITAESMTGCNR